LPLKIILALSLPIRSDLPPARMAPVISTQVYLPSFDDRVNMIVSLIAYNFRKKS
jgi:hypothetical protein